MRLVVKAQDSSNVDEGAKKANELGIATIVADAFQHLVHSGAASGDVLARVFEEITQKRVVLDLDCGNQKDAVQIDGGEVAGLLQIVECRLLQGFEATLGRLCGEVLEHCLLVVRHKELRCEGVENGGESLHVAGRLCHCRSRRKQMRRERAAGMEEISRETHGRVSGISRCAHDRPWSGSHLPKESTKHASDV